MTWSNAFKRATALLTVGLVLLIWTLLIYVAGFRNGIYFAEYPDYLSPQKGPQIANPTPMDT